MIHSVPLRIALFTALAGSIAHTGWGAKLDPQRIDGSTLGPVHYYAPAQGKKIDGLAIVISGSKGWDDVATQAARHLTDDGEVVVGLELPVYVAALKKESNDCVLVTRDLEVLSRDAEKDLPFTEFHPPLIVGIGAGAGIAYAAVGQVLPNTFAAGIALRFDPSFDLGHKMCLPVASAPGEPLRYAPAGDHETPFLFTPSPAFAAPGGGLQDFLAQMPQAHLIAGGKDDLAAIDDALRQLPHVGKAEESLDGLPVVEVPPPPGKGGKQPLVIFYSGDGGWRDIDKKIGGDLSDEGYFVVGVDSLRYFWRKKEPREMAADLDRLIRHYRAKFGDNGVLLLGYSFGADLLPFMVNRMAPDTKAELKLISLLGVSDRGSFEIRLQGILGAKNSDGPQTLPELVKIKNIPIQCVFGFDEPDSVCANKQLDGIVIRDELSGGHHFDGDYGKIADLIVAADKARSDVKAVSGTEKTTDSVK